MSRVGCPGGTWCLVPGFVFLHSGTPLSWHIGGIAGSPAGLSAKGFGCEMPKCSRCLRAAGRCAGLGGSRRGAGRRYFVRGKFIRAVAIPAQLHVLLLCLVLLLTLVHDSSRQSRCFPRAAWCLHLLLLSNLIFRAQTFLQHNLVGTLRVPPWLPPPLLLPLSNILALCFPTCSLCDLAFWTSLSQGSREVLGGNTRAPTALR